MQQRDATIGRSPFGKVGPKLPIRYVAGNYAKRPLAASDGAGTGNPCPTVGRWNAKSRDPSFIGMPYDNVLPFLVVLGRGRAIRIADIIMQLFELFFEDGVEKQKISSVDQKYPMAMRSAAGPNIAACYSLC